MMQKKAWHYCKDFLERVLGTNDDKLIAEHARCSIPVLIREIDEMRSPLDADVMVDDSAGNPHTILTELLSGRGC